MPIIITRRSAASKNMADDEEMLNRMCTQTAGIGISKGISPMARIYGWDRPSVTYGFHQDPRQALNLTRCESLGVPVVRRPTGGRAILHSNDLTVSLCCPLWPEIAGNSVASSAKICATPILEALASLGIPVTEVADSFPPRNLREGAPNCFDSVLPGDLTLSGEKIVGTAQVRRSGVLLQQMTIPLGPHPPPVYGEVFRPRTAPSSGARLAWEDLAKAVEGALKLFFAKIQDDVDDVALTASLP